MKNFTLTEKLEFIRTLFGTFDVSRNYNDVAVKCPFCGKDSSNKKKLVIQIKDDRIHCWVCEFKARSLIPLLKRAFPNHLKEYVDRFYAGSKYDVSVDVDVKSSLTLPVGFTIISRANSDHPDVRAGVRYLHKRKLSDADIVFYKLGMSVSDDRWNRRIIVPSFDKMGMLNFFTGRSIDATQFRKYDAPHVDKLPIIFNELNIDWDKPVVLCEGPFDAMKCGTNAIPLLGCELNEESLLFETIVINRTPVYLALDADMKLTKTPKIAKKLREYDVDVRVVDVETDPGDLHPRQFASLMSNAKSYNWADSMKRRVCAM